MAISIAGRWTNRSALVGFNAVASVFEWRDGAG
jgi:hypothetical protein